MLRALHPLAGWFSAMRREAHGPKPVPASAEGETRTRIRVASWGILSPLRLPIPPPRLRGNITTAIPRPRIIAATYRSLFPSGEAGPHGGQRDFIGCVLTTVD